MKIGDFVCLRMTNVAYGPPTEVRGIVIKSYEDPSSKMHRADYSAWWLVSLLVGGKIKRFSLYWDDEYEILSEVAGVITWR